MTAEERVRSYLSLVDFIAEVTGPNTEVVLHDVRDREHSLVAIRGKQLSERVIGAPMTEFASYILKHGRRQGKNYITNYLGKAGNNGKFLKSSTFFIRDEIGEIVGMLGINTDLSAISEVHSMLGNMLAVDESATNGAADRNECDEEGTSIKDMVYGVMEQVLHTYAVDPSRMTTEEKKKVVEALNERGVFLLKGIVAEVANRLEVSEQTIYRYLK